MIIRIVRWLFALSVAVVWPTSCLADAAIIPYHVSVEQAKDLQRLLDEHKSIILDSNSDYRTAQLSALNVTSGQRIVGGWNTRVPTIKIRGGASEIYIAQVRSNGPRVPDIIFSGGIGENNDVRIIGGSSGAGTNIVVQINDSARVNRLSIAEYGGLHVYQKKSGYVRNSVFTRLLGYWPGPQVDWHGNLAEPSGGNAFIAINSITPEDGSLWNNAGDLWMFQADCESWNGPGKGSRRCFTISGSRKVFSLSLSGGTAYPGNDGALAAYSNIDSLIAWGHTGQGGALEPGQVLDNVKTMVSVQSGMTSGDDGRSSDALRAIMSPLRVLAYSTVNGDNAGKFHVSGPNPLTAAFSATPKDTAPDKPTLRPINDALGAHWADNLKSRPDSSAMIQAKIDADGLARLPAGTYYLDRPLKIGSNRRTEGLLGADRDSVYLVAKGNFPVIEGRGDFPFGRDGTFIHIILERLTIYGGSYGINWTGDRGNIGKGGAVAFSTFSNLKFMKQTKGAVHASNMAGLDSNFWFRIEIADVPTAFLGRGTSNGAGRNYADKQFFLDCQFQNVSGAVWDWVSNRPSGGEVWKDNYFYRVGQISRTQAGNHLLWVNSVMEDVAGPVAIHVVDHGMTETKFFFLVDCLIKGKGPAVFADRLSGYNAPVYVDTEFSQSGGSIVADADPGVLFSWNSKITGTAKVGNVTDGLVVNSLMGPYNKHFETMLHGMVTVIDPTSAKPYRQVLAY